MSTSQSKIHGGYKEVETIEDPGGAIAVISQRIGHMYFTAAFFRVFERDGQKDRSAFFGPKHFDSLDRVMKITQKRLVELENGTASPNRRG